MILIGKENTSMKSNNFNVEEASSYSFILYTGKLKLREKRDLLNIIRP